MPIQQEVEGRRSQGLEEELAYTIDTTNYGGSPTGPTVTAYDLTDQYREVTTEILSGSASLSGDDITTPIVKSLTAGHIYRIEVKFTSHGQIYEVWFEVEAEKTSRPGMQYIIMEARRGANDTGQSTWTDAEILDILDRHREDFYREQLKPISQMIDNNGTISYVYHEYASVHQWLEGSRSGTTAWRIYNQGGTVSGTADYTADYRRGRIRFDADQGGSAVFLDARSYDVFRAIADLWRERASSLSERYDVDIDGHKLSRSQAFRHCIQMADYYDRQSKPTFVSLVRDDIL